MFTDELKQYADSAWQRYIGHPFFEAAGAGTLPISSFRFWLVQDLPYVVEYGYFRTVFAARAAEHADFKDIMTADMRERWPGTDEQWFLIDVLRQLGVENPDKSRFAARPAREGYMNHIARSVLEGDIGEGIAAIIPCDWGFTEWTSRLARMKSRAVDTIIAQWVEHYATEAHADLTGVSRALLDRAGQLAEDEQRQRLRLIFMRSLQHQVRVIDAAWLEFDPWPEETSNREIASRGRQGARTAGA